MNLRTTWTVVRATLPAPLALAAVALPAALVAAESPVAVPLTDAAERLWPLAALVGLPLGAALLETGDRWLERTSGRAVAVRAGLLGVVLALAATGAALGGLAVDLGGGSGAHPAETVRDLAVALALTLLTGTLVGPDAAWVPGLAAVVSCWLLGAAPPGVPPARWALLLLPIDDAAALAVTAPVIAVGTAVWVSGRSPRSA